MSSFVCRAAPEALGLSGIVSIGPKEVSFSLLSRLVLVSRIFTTLNFSTWLSSLTVHHLGV